MKKKDIHFARVFLPLIVRHMVRKGHLTESLLSDKDALVAKFKKHLREATRDLRTVVSLDTEFADESFRLWDRGRKLPAIVLFATAIEQALNTHYRQVLNVNGVSDESITAIIRNSTMDAKLTWLMEISTRSRFPSPLAKRFRSIAELRNSIVHYKAVPGTLDSGGDSYRAIQQRLSKLGRISLRRDYRLLTEFLGGTYLTHDSTSDLTQKIVYMLV